VPAVFQECERPVEILDENLPRGAVEMDLGGEAFADEPVADRHGGDDHFLALAGLAALDANRLAERQEFRIVLDPGNEGEHVVGRVRHGMPGLVDMHEVWPFRARFTRRRRRGAPP
jgi:hypothetical protein